MNIASLLKPGYLWRIAVEAHLDETSEFLGLGENTFLVSRRTGLSFYDAEFITAEEAFDDFISDRPADRSPAVGVVCIPRSICDPDELLIDDDGGKGGLHKHHVSLWYKHPQQITKPERHDIAQLLLEEAAREGWQHYP